MTKDELLEQLATMYLANSIYGTSIVPKDLVKLWKIVASTENSAFDDGYNPRQDNEILRVFKVSMAGEYSLSVIGGDFACWLYC